MSPTVNIITQEEIVCVWYFAAYAEKLNNIEELTMDVSDQSHWCADRYHIAF